ncbi:MAG: dipeptidase [Calditrichaceae bacterium]
MRITLSLITLLTINLFAQKNYQKIHDRALVVDMHTDVLLRHLRGEDIEHYSLKGQVDLDRLRIGGVDAVFFAVWPDPRHVSPEQMFDTTMAMIDTLHQIFGRNDDKIMFTDSPEQLQRALDVKKTAAFIGVEGGTAIENDLNKLNDLYNRGARYLGLTWNNSADWATSARDETNPAWQGHRGLTAFGKEVILRMNELGMIIDLSHSGEQTFYDVLAISKKPVIASHSSVYAICPHYRNLNDDQIRALAKNGGVMFINFYPGFLVDGFDGIYRQSRKDADAIEDSLKSVGSDEAFDRAAFIHSRIDSLYPGVSVIADHIDYVVQLVGDDYVGLGSDFDGISIPPAGLENVSKMPTITRELLRRGYSEDSIRKILGGNFERVLRKVGSKK